MNRRSFFKGAIAASAVAVVPFATAIPVSRAKVLRAPIRAVFGGASNINEYREWRVLAEYSFAFDKDGNPAGCEVRYPLIDRSTA